MYSWDHTTRSDPTCGQLSSNDPSLWKRIGHSSIAPRNSLEPENGCAREGIVICVTKPETRAEVNRTGLWANRQTRLSVSWYQTLEIKIIGALAHTFLAWREMPAAWQAAAINGRDSIFPTQLFQPFALLLSREKGKTSRKCALLSAPAQTCSNQLATPWVNLKRESIHLLLAWVFLGLLQDSLLCRQIAHHSRASL